MLGVGSFHLHLQGLFSRSPGQVVLSVVAGRFCPTGCLEPSEKERPMSRSWFCGGVPHSWEAQKPLVLTPAPMQKSSLPIPPPPPSWEDGICSPVTHFLNLWVEGGERGCAGSRVGGDGGGGRGKVTHCALSSSSVPALSLPQEQLSSQQALGVAPWILGSMTAQGPSGELRLVAGCRSMVKRSRCCI